jgi:hypothetical protein
MQAVIDRIMQTYDLLMSRSAAASADARARVTDYVKTLVEGGEKDVQRLAVCGLTYLRERRQRSGEGRLYRALSGPGSTSRKARRRAAL